MIQKTNIPATEEQFRAFAKKWYNSIVIAYTEGPVSGLSFSVRMLGKPQVQFLLAGKEKETPCLGLITADDGKNPDMITAAARIVDDANLFFHTKFLTGKEEQPEPKVNGQKISN